GSGGEFRGGTRRQPARRCRRRKWSGWPRRRTRRTARGRAACRHRGVSGQPSTCLPCQIPHGLVRGTRRQSWIRTFCRSVVVSELAQALTQLWIDVPRWLRGGGVALPASELVSE